MPAPADDEVTRLRVALARIARSVDRAVSGDGLTRTQLSVLGTVARLGPIAAGELADVEGLNPTMLSRLIGKLEVAGLLAQRKATQPTTKRTFGSVFKNPASGPGAPERFRASGV